MIKLIFALILVFLLSFQGFAVPLESLLTPNQVQQLQRSEQSRFFQTQLRNPVPVLLPQNNELQSIVTNLRDVLNPNMMVEVLYLYQKPAAFQTNADVWDSEQKTAVFNQLTAINTLTGIQYFSASRNTERTFYEFSHVIDNPQVKRQLPNPVFRQPPNTLTLFARQKDLTFGDNVYRYDYTVTSNVIIFVQENVTALSVGIIPVIGRGNLRSVLAVFDCGDTILVYAVSMARASSLPGLGDRVSNSFTNRAEALLNWLSDRLDNEVCK